jgi:lysine biosynthesis protein LysW
MQRCPECENDVDTEEIEALELDAGETFNCSACGTELKIVSIAPLTISLSDEE